MVGLGIFWDFTLGHIVQLWQGWVYANTSPSVYYLPNNAEHRENVRALPPDTRDWGKLSSPRSNNPQVVITRGNQQRLCGDPKIWSMSALPNTLSGDGAPEAHQRASPGTRSPSQACPGASRSFTHSCTSRAIRSSCRRPAGGSTTGPNQSPRGGTRGTSSGGGVARRLSGATPATPPT